MYNIVLIGPPGCGKGTQAKQISRELNIPHISTGEIFRAMVKEGRSKLSETVRGVLSRGELVSDDIVVDVVMERLREDDCKSGYLLDGFPRSLNQAKILDERIDNHLSHVILITVSDDMLMKRLTGRRTSPTSGKIYNVYFNPPLVEGKDDETGEDLVTRDDDKPDTVKNRIEIYKKQTIPAVEYYEEKGILSRINGEVHITKVFAQIKEVLSS